MRNLYYLLKIIRNSIPYKFRKYVSILLVIILGFFMFQSFAYAVDSNNFRDPTMWQRERTLNDDIKRSTVNVEASKTYPVSTLGADGRPIVQNRTASSSVKVPASVARVGKTLMKGAAQVAVASAIYDILGKSVDWVLDPANNSVTYTDPQEGGYGQCLYQGVYWQTPVSAGNEACKNNGGIRPSTIEEDPIWGFRATCVSGQPTTFSCQDYVPTTPIPKTIPIDTVASRVIENADSGEGAAMEVMTDTALDMLEEGLLDAELDAASNYPQPDPDKLDDLDPDIPPDPRCPAGYTKQPSGTCLKIEKTSTEFPAFCSWATKVCQFIDWVKTEPVDPPDGEGDIGVEIPDSQMHEPILERLYIDMPAQCPPDPILEFMNARIPFPMSVFCQFAVMMKPLILLFAYIKGLSIIGTGLS